MKRLSFAAASIVIFFFAACAAEQKIQTPGSNKPLVDAYVAAWNHRDTAAFDTLLARDAIHEDISQRFRGQGAAQIKDFMRAVLKAEPDFNWKVTNLIEDGSTLAVEWTWTSTYTGDAPGGPVVAMRISSRGASVIEVANGKIKRFTDYYDHASFFPPVKPDSAKK